MSNSRALIISVALEELGVKETSQNQGPGIEKYWKDTNDPDGYKNRYPYCASFVSYCVNEAHRCWDIFTIQPPRFEAVGQWRDWAQANDFYFPPRDPSQTPQVGDLVVFLPFFSHIGIVMDFDGDYVHTIEANTDKDGTREGDGIYQKTRLYNSCGGFIRIPCKSDAS